MKETKGKLQCKSGKLKKEKGNEEASEREKTNPRIVRV